MGPSARNAFTLIELMVVMAIMVLVSIFTLSNYRSFGEDQNLKNAVLDLQNQLRLAQSSATTNSECASSQYGATWQVVFSDTVTTNFNCQPLPSPLPTPTPAPTNKKTFKLASNIAISAVSGTGGFGCPTALPFTISFDPLTGKMTIGTDRRCTGVTITLRNSKTTNTEALVIEQGGNIYAQ